jgi:hypothetical protein
MYFTALLSSPAADSIQSPDLSEVRRKSAAFCPSIGPRFLDFVAPGN